MAWLTVQLPAHDGEYPRVAVIGYEVGRAEALDLESRLTAAALRAIIGVVTAALDDGGRFAKSPPSSSPTTN